MRLERELEINFQSKMSRLTDQKKGVKMVENPVFGALSAPAIPEEEEYKEEVEEEEETPAGSNKIWGTYSSLKGKIHELLLRTVESKLVAEPLLVSRCLWG